MKQLAIIEAIREILKGGTKIVSFTWFGIPVNATIGSIRAFNTMTDNECLGDRYLNEALLMNRANAIHLYAIDNNRNHIVSCWTLRGIGKNSFVKPRHYIRAFIKSFF